MRGTDKDLASHFSVICARGECLLGKPIEEVFSEVPTGYIMDSIRYDISDARESISGNPLYVTLNLARALAFREEGLILSKKEGGEWALTRIPEEFRPLISAALADYTESAETVYDTDLAVRYAGYMLDRLT